MRGRARRRGAACISGVGWARRLSSTFPSAPLRLHPRPGTTFAPRPVASSPVSLFRLTSPPRSFEVGSEGSGRGRGCSAHPHPTPSAIARGASHDCLPPGRGLHGVDPPVAPRGLCGVTGGGFPPRGRLPARRLPPLALDRSTSANRWLSAALGLQHVARPLPTPSEPRGLLPTPLPHSSHGYLVQFSRLLTFVMSLACLAPCFLSEPLPSALGGGGRREPGLGGPGG